MMAGTLYIVAAPSGAGKSSIVNAVLQRVPDVALSISYTSRAPRPGERHAQHYHFIGKDEFERMIAAGEFFEYALVHGDYKGTARQSVLPLPILELDYEQMVADIEPQARRIVDFIGLPWDPACLDFHQSERGVQTPSRWQVRQPVHTRSVGRWRNYAFALGPFCDVLEDRPDSR